jgi:ankyrin repeat protein
MSNNKDNGISPEYEQLYGFAERGDAVSFKRMLRSGLSVNFIHPMSTDSPLMIACRKGHEEVVQVCLDYGAKNDPHPDYGQTALHAAVSANQYECASILLKVAEASEADMIISNLTDQFGQTPLHSAATIGSVKLTELLLHHGAKISSVDSYGQTALHICAGLSNEKCLAVLLDQGGDEFIEATDIYGNTPLHHAAYNGRMECVKLLLETAADVTAKNFKNFSPYNLASMQGHKQVGDLLLAYRDNSVWQDQSITPVKYQLSTPAGKGLKDGEFQTPYTSDRLGSLRGSKDQVSPQVSELSVAIPEIRRNQSNQSTGSRESFDQLPRPYAVSSPAIGNKNSNKSKDSAASSPVEQARKLLEQNYNNNLLIKSHTNDYYVEDLGPKQATAEEVPILHQLATPLFVRNQSGGQRLVLFSFCLRHDCVVSN